MLEEDSVTLLFNTPLLWAFVSLLLVCPVSFYFYPSPHSRRVLPILDTGADKRDLVMKLGAEKWIDFKETKDLVKDIQDATDGLGPHAAVITAATGKAYEQAIDYLRPGGYLMAVGLPAKASLSADIFFTVTKSISILGSYVG